jgi:hypothetical protein
MEPSLNAGRANSIIWLNEGVLMMASRKTKIVRRGIMALLSRFLLTQT